MSQILATALGPYLGIVLSQRVDFTMIFLIASDSGCHQFHHILFVVSRPTHKTTKQVQAKSVKRFHISEFLEFRAIPISIIVMIVGFGYSVVLSFLSLYSKTTQFRKSSKLLLPRICNGRYSLKAFFRAFP